MRPLAIFVTVFGLICGCLSPAMGATVDKCWKHVLDIPGKSHNELKICRTGDQASHAVYYPNSLLKLILPTTCKSKGIATDGPERLTVFSFESGTCENGRTFKPARFVCQQKDAAMACKYEGFELVFKPINLQTRQP